MSNQQLNIPLDLVISESRLNSNFSLNFIDFNSNFAFLSQLDSSPKMEMSYWMAIRMLIVYTTTSLLIGILLLLLNYHEITF